MHKILTCAEMLSASKSHTLFGLPGGIADALCRVITMREVLVQLYKQKFHASIMEY